MVVKIENDPILSGRLIRSFRHLELKNPCIISDFRYRTRMVQEFWRRRRSSSRRRSAVLLEDVMRFLLYISIFIIVLSPLMGIRDNNVLQKHTAITDERTDTQHKYDTMSFILAIRIHHSDPVS